MTYLIPRRARLNDVLSVRRLIVQARDDLVRGRHHLAEVRTTVRLVELEISTAEAAFESIVAIYNRLVVEYEPQAGKERLS